MMQLRLKSLAADERGASLIEFGFLAPVLALMSMGIADLSRALSDRFSVQSAVNRSIELLQAHPVALAATSSNTSGNTTSTSCGNYCFVQTEAQNAAGAGATVTLTTWHECQDAAENTSMVAFDADCPGSTTSVGRYVRVKVQKTFKGFYFASIPMDEHAAVRVQ